MQSASSILNEVSTSCSFALVLNVPRYPYGLAYVWISVLNELFEEVQFTPTTHLTQMRSISQDVFPRRRFVSSEKKNISAENAADQRGRFTSKEVRQRRSLIKYIFWGKWSICVDLPYPYHILPDPRKRLTDTVSSSHPEDASCNLYSIRTCFWSLVWPITATIAYVVLCGMLE